jgi:hypothetical protein
MTGINNIPDLAGYLAAKFSDEKSESAGMPT